MACDHKHAAVPAASRPPNGWPRGGPPARRRPGSTGSGADDAAALTVRGVLPAGRGGSPATSTKASPTRTSSSRRSSIGSSPTWPPPPRPRWPRRRRRAVPRRDGQHRADHRRGRPHRAPAVQRAIGQRGDGAQARRISALFAMLSGQHVGERAAVAGERADQGGRALRGRRRGADDRRLARPATCGSSPTNWSTSWRRCSTTRRPGAVSDSAAAATGAAGARRSAAVLRHSPGVALAEFLYPASEFEGDAVGVLEVERAHVHTGVHRRGRPAVSLSSWLSTGPTRTPLSLSRCRYASNFSAGT